MDVTYFKKGLFESLTKEELEKIIEIAKETDVIAGDYIFDEGAEASSLFIVKFGTIEISKKGMGGEEGVVTQFAAGSHFGEISFVDRQKRSAAAMAKENTKLIEISFSKLEDLITAHPVIGAKLFRQLAYVLCRRIRQTTADLSSLKELKLRQI